MPGVMCGSMVSTVRNLALELVCIRALSLAHALFFILVLEAFLHEFHIGVPWELLHADDLVCIAKTQEDCISKLKA